MSAPYGDTPGTEPVSFGNRRWGSFLFGEQETFLAFAKIRHRLPPYIVQNELLKQIVGGLAKQVEIHRRDVAALAHIRRSPELLALYCTERGLLLGGYESVPEMLWLLAKREFILTSRGAIEPDPDAGIRGETNRITRASGETVVQELDRSRTGWWVVERKASIRPRAAHASFPHINRWGRFSRRENHMWMGAGGMLFVLARNRNAEHWSAAEIEVVIRRYLVPADVIVEIHVLSTSTS